MVQTQTRTIRSKAGSTGCHNYVFLNYLSRLELSSMGGESLMTTLHSVTIEVECANEHFMTMVTSSDY